MKICNTHGKEFKPREGKYGLYYYHIIDAHGDIKDSSNYHNVDADKIGEAIKAEEETILDDVDPGRSEVRESLEESRTDWDAVARGNMYLEAQKIAHGFYSKKDIDDEAKIDSRAEQIYLKAWEKRVGK